MGHTRIQEEYSCVDVPDMFPISEFLKASRSYIPGYVLKMTYQEVNCIAHCISVVKYKDRGGLVKPSSSVVVVCEETEKSCHPVLEFFNMAKVCKK